MRCLRIASVAQADDPHLLPAVFGTRVARSFAVVERKTRLKLATLSLEG